MSIWPDRPADHTPDKTGRPDEPWLTRDAISFLDRKVHDGMRVLEYGSGASTVWFSRRAGRVDSIEHDQEWFERTCRAVDAAYLRNVGVHHIPADDDFESYVQFGRGLCLERCGLLDLVIVDGRRRVRCIKAIAEFVAPDGMIVLDNAERPNYDEAHKFLSHWFVRRTTNGIWRTDIFKR